MNVAVIGAGNIAWHLSKAFINAGFPVKQIWNRTAEGATDLALEIGADSITDLALLSDDVDLVVMAVSDKAISEIAAQLQLKEHQVLVHTSGSVSLHVIKNFAAKTGVIYPLQTFSKEVQVDFTEIPVFIEGDSPETVNRLETVVEKLSSKVYKADSAQRIKLHIAAVFACNFTNHFYALAQELLTSSGLDFDFIKPLIKETVQKAVNGNPKALQTGPAIRNDADTMSKHLEMLNAAPQLQELYKLVSQSIVKMYHESEVK